MGSIVLISSLVGLVMGFFVGMAKLKNHSYEDGRNGLTKKFYFIIISIVLLTFCICFIVVNLFVLNYKDNKLFEADRLIEEGNFPKAIEIYNEYGEEHQVADANFLYAQRLFEEKNYEDAKEIFNKLVDNNTLKKEEDKKSAYNYLEKIRLYELSLELEDTYKKANTAYNDRNYKLALEYFTSILDYKDSSKMALKCKNAQTKYNTISAGSLFSMGIDKNGKTVLTTEFPDENWIKASKWEGLRSISCGGHVVIGLKDNGTAVVESVENNIDVSEWKNLSDVSAGYQYVVGLKKDGKVIGAGHNGDGQYTQDWEDIIAIATGWRHTVGLDSNGNIHIVGYGSTNQKREINENPNAWSNIIAIAAGGGIKDADGKGHTVGLREDGRVVAVGDNNWGQCNVDEWDDIVAISAGDWHTVGLKSDGTVVIASTHKDANLLKKCEDWKNIVAISAGTGFVLGLTEDGTVLSAGYLKQDQRPDSGTWNDIKVYDFWPNVSD